MICPSKLTAPEGASVVRYAESELPTKYGATRVFVYREAGDDEGLKEHVAVMFGRPTGPAVLARIHSECLTSEILGSLKCDCAQQLDDALRQMSDRGEGVLLYLRQEGRGIGLGNKVRAYALQAKGADTVQANHQLGFDADLRRYDIAADMLRDLDVESVTLLTNNPRKVAGLEENGIEVVERKEIYLPHSLHARRYLATKRAKLGHLIDVDEEPLAD